MKLELLETDYNEAFLRGFLPKLDWDALVKTARELGDTSLPETSPDINDAMMDEDVLKNLHRVLLEVGDRPAPVPVTAVLTHLPLLRRCTSPRASSCARIANTSFPFGTGYQTW